MSINLWLKLSSHYNKRNIPEVLFGNYLNNGIDKDASKTNYPKGSRATREEYSTSSWRYDSSW